MALSQTRADKIKKPGRYGDGRNVYLRVMEGGSRSWIFRYELRGRERVMGLGPCADFTLEEARERARLARQLLKDGIDPLAKTHEARAQVARAAAKSITFAQAADAYYKFHAAKWTNDRYKKLLLTRLNEYAGIPPRWTLPEHAGHDQRLPALHGTGLLVAIDPVAVVKDRDRNRRPPSMGCLATTDLKKGAGGTPSFSRTRATTVRRPSNFC